MNSRTWLITLPSIGMILLFAAWSGYWYFLMKTATSEIESSFPRLEKSGITLTCTKKSFGGYPFRMRFDCAKPSLSVTQGRMTAHFKADHLTLLAQAYKLRHIIGEVSGPVEFESRQSSDTPTIPDTVTRGRLKHNALRASVELASLPKRHFDPQDLEALSVISHQTSAAITKTTAWGQKIPLFLTADKTGFHIRYPRKPGQNGIDTDLAIEATGLKLQGGFYTPLEENKFTAKRVVLNSLVRQFYPALFSKNSLAKNWYQLGGAAEIDALLVEREDFTFRGEGVLSLNSDGQLSGSLDTKFLGMENILKTLVDKKTMTSNQAVLAYTGMRILSKSTEAEQKSKILSVPVRFANGQVYFGPHSLGFSPSLF